MTISPASDTIDDTEHRLLFRKTSEQEFRKERLYSMQPRQRKPRPIAIIRKRTL